jgi:hypothetical protein
MGISERKIWTVIDGERERERERKFGREIENVRDRYGERVWNSKKISVIEEERKKSERKKKIEKIMKI